MAQAVVEMVIFKIRQTPMKYMLAKQVRTRDSLRMFRALVITNLAFTALVAYLIISSSQL